MAWCTDNFSVILHNNSILEVDRYKPFTVRTASATNPIECCCLHRWAWTLTYDLDLWTLNMSQVNYCAKYNYVKGYYVQKLSLSGQTQLTDSTERQLRTAVGQNFISYIISYIATCSLHPMHNEWIKPNCRIELSVLQRIILDHFQSFTCTVKTCATLWTMSYSARRASLVEPRATRSVTAVICRVTTIQLPATTTLSPIAWA